jgi:CRISPR-associated protein (TIGR02710 family)
MATEQPIKALLIAITDEAAAALYTVNRLKPELLCFFAPESAKSLVEKSVQPCVEKIPRKWDWIITPDARRVMASYRALARALPGLMRAWDVRPGELVVDLTGATPAMASALSLASLPFTSRIVMVGPVSGPDEEVVSIEGQARVWEQGNPWDEAVHARAEACEHFNRGAFDAAARLFRQLETRVSGAYKPLDRALADLAEGYGLWERFLYREAWDKLKMAYKALEMAAVWGGPPGLKAVLPTVQQNAGFLEKLVLDPGDVKEAVALDLLAHARRRVEVQHDYEAAMVALVRALEAFAQVQLFHHYRIKTWDVRLEQLPEALRDKCRSCFQSDLDGRYKLPLQAQFQALASLGSRAGQAYLAQWPKMKPLFDAAERAVLGHGFETVKPERVRQLYQLVVTVMGVSESSLPQFPVLHLA